MGQDFDRLFSLFVADWLQAMLQQQCRNFILTAESADPKSAYMCDNIASMADIYHATQTYDGNPKIVGHESGSRFVNKPESIGGNNGPVNNQVTNANRVSSETQVKTPFSKAARTCEMKLK